MTLLVVDSSALCELLLLRDKAERVAQLLVNHQLYAPQLLTVEVMSVLRGWLRSGQVTEFRANQALTDFLELPIILVNMELLVANAWKLKNNVSAYDAMYVALAQALDCRLLTCDAKLARVIGRTALVP